MSDDERSITLSDGSDSEYTDYTEDEDFHPNTSEEASQEEDVTAEFMGDLRAALEKMKEHFEKCGTPKAHLYLAMIDQGADALDAYWKDHPGYGF